MPAMSKYAATAGAKQSFDPAGWGLTVQQLLDLRDGLRKDPRYDRSMTMKQVVETFIKPETVGKKTGMSYALQVNGGQPKRAEALISHSWAESFEDFVEAVFRGMMLTCGMTRYTVIWVCALCQYQNRFYDDGTSDCTNGPNLKEQMELDPFGSVVAAVKDRYGVKTIFTSSRSYGWNPYTRKWVVYEMGYAIYLNVKVTPWFVNVADVQQAVGGNFEASTAEVSYPPDSATIDAFVLKNVQGGWSIVNSRVRDLAAQFHNQFEVTPEHWCLRVEEMTQVFDVLVPEMMSPSALSGSDERRTNVHDVVSEAVGPFCKGMGMSIALQSAIANNRPPKPLQVFVSHLWSIDIYQLMTAIQHGVVTSGMRDDVLVWIKFLSMDGDDDVQKQITLLKPIEMALRSKPEYGFSYVLNPQIALGSRAYSVHEVTSCIELGIPVHAWYDPATREEAVATHLEADATYAMCSAEADQEMIHRKIQETIGYAKLNQFLLAMVTDGGTD